MQKTVFILFLSLIVTGHTQYHLIVKSNHFNSDLFESSLKISPIHDDYH